MEESVDLWSQSDVELYGGLSSLLLRPTDRGCARELASRASQRWRIEKTSHRDQGVARLSIMPHLN